MSRLAPRPSVFFLAALFTACSPSDRPAETIEALDATPFSWRPVHGVTGSLILLEDIGGGRGRVRVILTCRDLVRGGLSLRGYSGGAGPLTLTAGPRVFSTPARTLPAPAPRAAISSADLEPMTDLLGEGQFPPGWFGALADASEVVVGNGGVVTPVPGPGREAAENFRRYCARLDAVPAR